MKKVCVLLPSMLLLMLLSACSTQLNSVNAHDAEPEPQVEELAVAAFAAVLDPLDETEETPWEVEQQLIRHEADGSSYFVTVAENVVIAGYTIHLQRTDAAEVWAIPLTLERIQDVDFQDLNLDGYTDLVLTTNRGALNEVHELFLFDPDEQTFVQVGYEVEMLAALEVHEGYLRNWCKDAASSGVVQTLVWDGSHLILEAEETYQVEDVVEE